MVDADAVSRPSAVGSFGLSGEQLGNWDRYGYLVIPNLLDPNEVDRTYAAVHACLAAGARTIDWHSSFTDQPHTTRIRNAITQCPELAYVLDHPRLVDPLISLLSESVHILGTEIFVRRCQSDALEGWHTDGGAYLQQIRLAPGSQSLQLKCQIFLTDVSHDDSGNLLLIPGSHREPAAPSSTCYLDGLNDDMRRGLLPEGAVSIHASKGDAVFFPYSLWHAVGSNRRQPRTSLIFRYGQLWHRPNDYLQQPPDVLNGLSPRLRRMFGDFGDAPSPLDFYKPADQSAVMSTTRSPADLR